MSLQAFSMPQRRFFRAGDNIFKFSIRGNSYSEQEVIAINCFSQELEEIIRTVLGNLENLQPFCSTHFVVFPYKRWWEGVSKVMCKHGDKRERFYPFIIILYLERNMQSGEHAEDKSSPRTEFALQFPSVSEPQSKRHRSDSPLEEAILKDLIKDLEAERRVSMSGWTHVDSPHVGWDPREDPGHVEQESHKPHQTAGVTEITESGSPGEVHPGTIDQDVVEEEEDKKAEPGAPVKAGILTQLASHIFPFFWFFRDH